MTHTHTHTPTAIPFINEQAAIRFWSSVQKSSGCWCWTGQLSNKRYGLFAVSGYKKLAHRVSWSINKGAIPKKTFVLHTCDNRQCVNPAHLFLGDNASNMIDAVRKGRQGRVARTHCPHGHPYSGANLYLYTYIWKGKKTTKRFCRACQGVPNRRAK